MKRGLIAIGLSLIIVINCFQGLPVNAGGFADLFGIQDDTGGFITDNGIDYGLSSLSDAGQSQYSDTIKEAMRKFHLSERLRETGRFQRSSRYFREQTTQYINNASRMGRYVRYLGGAMQVLNVYNTSVDTYKLITEDSKHTTYAEKVVDKTLGAVDAGMGWYAIGLGAVAIISAPTIGAGVVAAGAVTGTTYLVSKLTVGVTRIAFNSQTYRDFSALVRGEKKLVFAPFESPNRKEGLAIIEEELGFDLYPGLRREIPDPQTGIPVYKPNIYLYSSNEEAYKATIFVEPSEWITESIPVYNPLTGWKAEINNGSLNGCEDYLFYEAVVPDKGFELEKGHLVNSDRMEEELRSLMKDYGFSKAETDDFTEYWIKQLSTDTDYVFYPQKTEIVERIMPINSDISFDSYYRLWFYIIPYKPDSNIKWIQKKDIVPIERKGRTLIEWGGLIR